MMQEDDRSELQIQVCRDGYRVAWWFPEDEDFGIALGDRPYTPKDLPAPSSARWDHIAASLAVADVGTPERDDEGLLWPTEAAARRALKVAQAAMARRGEQPWPEWAMTAHAAGWTPPKGWKP